MYENWYLKITVSISFAIIFLLYSSMIFNVFFISIWAIGFCLVLFFIISLNQIYLARNNGATSPFNKQSKHEIINQNLKLKKKVNARKKKNSKKL